MSELSRLISRINNAILTKAPFLESIRYPDLLVSSLEELNELIGNHSVKDSVATQVAYLIAVKTSKSDSHIENDHVMLNTILYGPPGVGKTLVGTKLAKIWYSLGFLDGSKKIIPLTREQEREKEIREVMYHFEKIRKEKGGFSPAEELNKPPSDLMVSLFIIFISFMAWIYEKYGWILTTLFTLFIIFVLYLYFYLDLFDDAETKEDKDKPTIEKKEDNGVMPSDEEIITVVSRADFVEKYVGWSAKKTLKLLNANLGKVLFVDEAYSLVNNGLDSFGIEVLNTINLFLSEHPGEIIVIFAGYKDLLENGVFSFQPGLSRRFMWHFECEGYSYTELFEIFLLQLERTEWGVSNVKATKQLFRKHKDDFPNFGGDTERLTFFSKLEHSREYLDEYNTLTTKKLTPRHIRRGIRTLRKNNIKK